MRNGGGAWCGYVRIPETHICHGEAYDRIMVDVHGGLTFSGPRSIRRDGPEEGWWIGFDCAHAGDCCPGYMHLLPESLREERDHYWSIEEAMHETETLARQMFVTGISVG